MTETNKYKNQVQRVNTNNSESVSDMDSLGADYGESTKLDAPKTANENEFPDKGLSHLRKVEYLDLLQSTVTPFDFYSPVQIIRHPKKNDEFLTVQIVK